MNNDPNDPRIRALAELIHHLRPAWNRAGIIGALHAASKRPLDQLIRASIDAALDPDAATPAVIQHRDGAAWAATPTRPKPSPQPPPISTIDLGQPNPQAATRGAAAARAALHPEQS